MKRLSHRAAAALLAAACVGLAALAAGLGWFGRVDLMQYDLHFRVRGSLQAESSIVIVGLDSESKDRLGINRRISRRTWALALYNMARGGARTIGVDVFWTQSASRPGPAYEYPRSRAELNRILAENPPTADELLEKDPAWNALCNDRAVFERNMELLLRWERAEDEPDLWLLHEFDEDELLECVLNLFPNAVLPITEGSGGRPTGPYRGFQLRAADMGSVRLERDADEIVRRLAPVYRYPVGDQVYDYPAFSLAVAAHFLGEDWERTLERIPGRSLIINYRGYPGAFETIPLWKLVDPLDPLNPELDLGVFEDKIVMIGSIDPLDQDMFFIPFSSGAGALRARGVDTAGLRVRGGAPSFGVEIHANAAATILAGDGLRELPPAVWWLIFAGLALVLAWLNIAAPAAASTWATLGLAVALPVAGHLAFVGPGLFTPVAALLLTAVLLKGVLGIYKRSEVVQLFGRFVPPAVVKQMVDNPKLAEQAGERRSLSILFSDIRGFTTLSEGMSPEEVVAMLNDYLERMTEIVFETGGTLDKFIGDAVMAFWGAPLGQPDHAERAVRAALEMHKALDELKARWRGQGRHSELEIGIGINAADVVVGNIGSRKRVDYTVIGDGVNLASRLEGLCKQYGVGLVVSESVYRVVEAGVWGRELDKVQVKGKKNAIRIYEVMDFRQDADNR